MLRPGAILAILLAGAARAAVPGGSTPPADSTAARFLAISPATDLSARARQEAFGTYVSAVRRALGEGHAARARDLSEHAVRLFPGLRRPLLHLAAARLQLEQWGPAIEAARQAETARADDYAPSSEPPEISAAYWEGVALYRTQRYDECLPRLRAASASAPGWAEAARALGEALFVAGRSQDAAEAYSRAFAIDPDIGSARDLSYFAEAQAARGDLAGGIAALQEALARDAFAPGLHAKLGDLLRREGNRIEAYYQLLLELVLHGVEGPFAGPALQMTQSIVESVRAEPPSPARHELLAVAASLAQMDAEEPHAAVHVLAHAVSGSRSATPMPRLLLADAYLRDGKLALAREQLDAILTLDADFVPALNTLAEVQSKLGDEAAAESTRQRIRSLFPDYWKLRAH